MLRKIKCFACGEILQDDMNTGDIVICPKCETEILVPDVGGGNQQKTPSPQVAPLSVSGRDITSIKLPFTQVLRLTMQVVFALLLVGLAVSGVVAIASALLYFILHAEGKL